MTQQSPDLSRIDFSHCKLPEWNGRQWFAVEVSPGVVHIRNGAVGSAMSNHGGEWHTGQGAQLATLDELAKLPSLCRTVDTFITSELARLKLEDEYPWSAEQAREFLRTHPGEHALDELWPSGLHDTLWFRFRNGAPEYSSSPDSATWIVAGAIKRYHLYRIIESRMSAEQGGTRNVQECDDDDDARPGLPGRV